MILRGGGKNKNATTQINPQRKSARVRSDVGCPPNRKTDGEVGGLAEKLIQLGRTSQQRHVGFEHAVLGKRKTPFSRSQSLHILQTAGFAPRLKLIPKALRVRLSCLVQRKDPSIGASRFAERTRGAARGVPHTEWMNAV